MEARLAAGESCVVQLVSTMEAATERAYAKAVKNGDDLRDLDVTPRDQLLQFVEASFPTTLYEEYLDDDGRVRSRPVKNAAGDFVQSPEAVAARDRLMLEVGAVSVPHGVLDQVVAHFGPDAVAEVTGRGRRFVTKTVDGVEQVVEERRTRRTCNAEADEFMAGKRRVLVFSQAGGTGRSYHSDLAADNQERRVLYCVEPGWSSARCVQGMGRVHRANQACPPELVLVTTNLKAQRRFLSTIARRLDQLGALTKGQRQTASQGLLSSEFNLETPLSRASLHNWFVDLYRGEGRAVASGVTPTLVEEQMGIKVLDADGQLNVGCRAGRAEVLEPAPVAPDGRDGRRVRLVVRLPGGSDRGRPRSGYARRGRRDHPGRARGQDRRATRLHARAVRGDDAGRDAGAHPADGDRGLERDLALRQGGPGAGVLGRVRGQPEERAALRALPRREPDDRDRPRSRKAPPRRRAVQPADGRDRDQSSGAGGRPPAHSHR